MVDVLRGGIAINEVLVDPNGAINYDTDGNGTAANTDEYVELVNTSGSAIDIGGLQLWDAGTGLWFTFPDSPLMLEPGAHALVITGVQTGGSLPTGDPDDLFFDAGRSSPLINNGGDNVVVYDPLADEYILATYNGDAQDTPETDYAGFSGTATQVGAGENMGNDTDGLSLQRVSDTSDTWTTDTPTPGTTNICFTAETLIDTPDGPRPAGSLVAGDLVTTLDHGARPVMWVWSKPVPACQMDSDPKQAPVRIAANALGPGVPQADLYVSRQHRVMVSGRIAERMFGTDEVLVPAHFLTELPGVSVVRPKRPISYVHLLLKDHEVVLAEGAPAETLYLGDQAVLTIPPEQRGRIEKALGLKAGGLAEARPPRRAREFVQGKRAVRLVERHKKNAQHLSRAVLVPA